MMVSDLLYDAELIIKDDDGKYYEAKMMPNDVVVDGDGIIVKVILSKGKRITRKELLK